MKCKGYKGNSNVLNCIAATWANSSFTGRAFFFKTEFEDLCGDGRVLFLDNGGIIIQKCTYVTVEVGLETHSSVLAWRILGMEEPGGLQSMGSHRAQDDWSDLARTHAHVIKLHRAIHTHTHTHTQISTYKTGEIWKRSNGLYQCQFPGLVLCSS